MKRPIKDVNYMGISAEILRNRVKQYIDHADEKVLRMIQAILEINEEYDLWDELPEEVKTDINEAIVQSNRGEGKEHGEVMKIYSQGLTK